MRQDRHSLVRIHDADGPVPVNNVAVNVNVDKELHGVAIQIYPAYLANGRMPDL